MTAVSDLSLYCSIALGGSVCLVYTAFVSQETTIIKFNIIKLVLESYIFTPHGGMNAVIWVDNIQLLIVALGMTLLAAKGTVDAGGMTKVWETYTTIGERNKPANEYIIKSIPLLYNTIRFVANKYLYSVLTSENTLLKLTDESSSIWTCMYTISTINMICTKYKFNNQHV